MGHYLGVLMFFIGFILILNAAWLQGKLESKDVGIFNLIVGSLVAAGAQHIGVEQGNMPLSAAFYLFGFTYLWVGINAVRGATDQRALGGYCLLVAVATLPYAIQAYLGGDIGFAFEWLTWGVLWFLFFMVLTLGNQRVMGLTVFMTYFVGIEVTVTGWLFLYGYWPFGK
jgi:putative amide transporter protein